jgi:hypothetical protein
MLVLAQSGQECWLVYVLLVGQVCTPACVAKSGQLDAFCPVATGDSLPGGLISPADVILSTTLEGPAERTRTKRTHW